MLSPVLQSSLVFLSMYFRTNILLRTPRARFEALTTVALKTEAFWDDVVLTCTPSPALLRTSQPSSGASSGAVGTSPTRRNIPEVERLAPLFCTRHSRDPISCRSTSTGLRSSSVFTVRQHLAHSKQCKRGICSPLRDCHFSKGFAHGMSGK
jgi:hypothetical protein